MSKLLPKWPKHPLRSLWTYIRIFGMRAPFLAAKAFMGGRRTRVRVARRWAPHPLYVRLNSSDLDVFRQVFMEQEYAIVDHARGPFEVIIDAGANIGLTSVYLAARYPQARIYAVEPDRGNFEMLRLNTRSCANVRCILGALWHRDEPVSIVSQDAADWAFRVEHDHFRQENQIEGLRVHTLIDRCGEAQVSLLKMDIEGAELEVLGDAQAWIGRVRNIVVELHERLRPGCDAAFEEATEEFEHLASSAELTLVARA